MHRKYQPIIERIPSRSVRSKKNLADKIRSEIPRFRTEFASDSIPRLACDEIKENRIASCHFLEVAPSRFIRCIFPRFFLQASTHSTIYTSSKLNRDRTIGEISSVHLSACYFADLFRQMGPNYKTFSV